MIPDMRQIEQRMLDLIPEINALIDEVNNMTVVNEKHWEIAQALKKAQQMMEDLFKEQSGSRP